MYAKRVIKLTLIATVSVVLLVSCSATTPVSTDAWWNHYEPGHTKDEILNDFNLHRGKWWNYYARGCWLEEGGFYDEAISDLKKSLQVRSTDQRSARSYGMHFWDYFPHRELGICLYNVGKYEEAINELNQSLTSVDTSKAKFYLNKAREAFLVLKGVDSKAPEILVTSFKDGDYVNSRDISIKGVVKDDYFSDAIWINNRKLFIELASKNLDFDRKIRLEYGENTISLKASDLVGNKTDQTIKLTVDMRSPVILLDEIPERVSPEQKTVNLKGSLVDNSAVAQFWINDKEVVVEKGKEIAFDENVDISLSGTIKLRAIDVAGNNVYGEYSLNEKSAMLPSNPFDLFFKNGEYVTNYPQLASTDNSSLVAAIDHATIHADNAGKVDTTPPKITTDLRPLTVYEGNYIISGEVHDKKGVCKILINDEEIKSYCAKQIFFNHILSLEEGDNNINIIALDSVGNKSEFPATTITKKSFELLETDSRYTVAMLPLKRVGVSSASTGSIYPMLIQGFETEPKRFNFVERDQEKLLEVLKEQKISNSDLGSPDTVIKIGKIRAAEGMLFGTIVEDEKGLNVSINLVDTETTKVLATSDVYGEDKNVDNVRWLMKGLALKLKQKFPMLQGTVVYVSKKGFFVDCGTDMGAALGMKLLLFREVDLGMMKIKEPQDIVAQIVQVDKKSCMAKIISGSGTIEKTDLVITK